MLADPLAPHGGIVMWRAFVYSDQSKVDRAAQALNEFKPLDGQFHDNIQSETESLLVLERPET